MQRNWWIAASAALCVAAAGSGPALSGQASQRPAAPAAGGPGGALLQAMDANRDGSLTAEEMSATFERWHREADTAKTGSVTAEQLGMVLDAAMAPEAECGGRSPRPRIPCAADVEAMRAALPEAAAAKPKKPRRILVLSIARGFVHSSIPLAAQTIEEMGKKTGAWTATTSYDAADVNAQNLAGYDAIFLNNTTGLFLDAPGDDAAHEARKAALLAFVRGGKGIAALHAASDTYHGDPAAPRWTSTPGAGGGLGVLLAPRLLASADQNGDAKFTREEVKALGGSWFTALSAGASTVSVSEASPRLMGVAMAGRPGGGARPAAPQNVALWPEFNRVIGGFFKWHWNDPQLITVKLDDPGSPINAPFKGQAFEVRDETYTFPPESWSRANVRVLTSVDYSKMSDEDKAKEPAAGRRTDGDYGLCWIRREGQGRMFYEAHGHAERLYANRPWLEHLLAGVQYALGDLEADATPKP